MRPIQLEVTNFGPYRKEVINFAQFDEAPLFLIGGDTGAGKSTLFDAMTVALFATTTGDRSVEEMRSTFAGPKDDLTQVTFYFQQGKHLYRIQRVIRQERAKRGGGTTIQEPKASLVIVDKVGGQEVQKLADKIKEVNTEIEAILGLNAEQFKQIILLPQNDFSRFLKEDSKNKTLILKKIFGTGLFDRFKRSLEDRYRESSKDLAKHQSQLEGHFTSQVWSKEELDDLAETPVAEKLEEAARLLAKRQEELEDMKVQLAESEKDLGKQEASVQEARDLDKAFRAYQDLENRYQVEILDLADQYLDKRQHLVELEFSKSLQKAVDQRDYLTKQVQELSHQVEEEQVAFEEQVVELDNLSKKLSQLEDQAPDIAKKKTQLSQWEKDLIHAQTLEKERALAEKEEEKWQKAARTLKEVQEQTKDLEEKVEQAQEKLMSRESLDQAEKTYQVVGRLVEERLNSNHQELESKRQHVQIQIQRQKKLELQLDQVTEELEGLQAELDETLVNRRQLMIAQLQAELEEGQACMVCGSTDHPKIKTKEADEVALKDLMLRVENLQNKRDSKRADQSHLQATLTEVTSQVESLRQEEKASQNLLAKHFQDLQETLSFWSGLTFEQTYSPQHGKAILYEVKQEVEALQTAYAQAQATLNDRQEQLERKQGQLAAAQLDAKGAETSRNQSRNRLADLESHHPDLQPVQTYETWLAEVAREIKAYENERENKRQAYQTASLNQEKRQGHIDSLSKSLSQNQESLAQVQEVITSALSADSALTQDSDQLYAWLTELKEQKDLALQAQVTAYETKKATLEQDLAKAQEELKGKQAPLLAPLEESLAEQKALVDQEKASFSVAQEGLKAVQATYQAAKTLQESNQARLKAFQELSDLVKVVKGEGGVTTGKLDLEVYVIRQYFQQILDYANSHYIGLLTDNRYAFVLSEEGRKAREHYGLDINVYDQLTGTERSVKSLSGGETFIAALAIALSLSEVVQNTSNGAVVEALFIDEGFGSLDKEALSKAISVLEQIGENRMVGLISHVDDMKETIAQQLAIVKEHDGSSRIKIINKA